MPDNPKIGPLDDGTYRVEVEKVERKESQAGNEYWKLELRVLEGEFSGRKIRDSLHFTERAYPRLKLILLRLGFVMQDEMEIEPSDLKGRRAKVTVAKESYTYDGENRVGNKVTFDGWAEDDGDGLEISSGPAEVEKPKDDDEPPF